MGIKTDSADCVPESAFACSLKPLFNASFFGPVFAIRALGLLGETDRSLVFLLRRTIGMLLTIVGWRLYPFYSFMAITCGVFVEPRLKTYLRASSAGISSCCTLDFSKLQRYPLVAFGVEGINTETYST